MADNVSTDERLLTPVQRRLVAFALAFFALTLSIALFIGLFILAGRLIGHFSGVLWPLAAAGILALILRPVVEIFQDRLKLGRLSAVILLYGLFILAVTALALAIIPPLIEQLFDLIAFVPTFWKNAGTYVQDHYPQWVDLARRQMSNPTIKKLVDGAMSQAQQLLSHAIPTLQSAGVGVMNLTGFITHLAILPIYLFFFLLSRRDPTGNLETQLNFLRPGVRKDVVFLVGEFIAIIVSFFRGQLLIGLIMGALLAVGFTLVGLKFGLFIGLMLGILNIVPYLGTIIGLSIALPLAFFQPGGGWTTVWLVLLVFVLVQMIEGWFLTPKIMSDRTGLHPIAIIVAVFFWGTAFSGILGMILAIPLTAFFVTAWRLAKRKYIHTAT